MLYLQIVGIATSDLSVALDLRCPRIIAWNSGELKVEETREHRPNQVIEVTEEVGSREKVINTLFQMGKHRRVIQIDLVAAEYWVNSIEVIQIPFQCLLLIKGSLWLCNLIGEIKTPAEGIMAWKQRIFTDTTA